MPAWRSVIIPQFIRKSEVWDTTILNIGKELFHLLGILLCLGKFLLQVQPCREYVEILLESLLGLSQGMLFLER